MPSNLTYPGVYVEEIPSGVRTIVGVATSITAFLGRAKRGPVNEPIIVNNFGDFERVFGGLAADHTLAFAVHDFFGNGGSQAVIVRLYKPFFPDEVTRDQAFTDATDEAKDAADEVSNEASEAADEDGASAQSVRDRAIAKADGVDPEKHAAWLAAHFVAGAAQKEANKTDPPPPDADSVAQAAADSVDPAVQTAAITIAPRIRASLRFENGLVLEAASPGAWGNSLTAQVDYDTKRLDDGGPDPALFNLTINDASSGRSEMIRNVTGQPDGIRLVTRVLANESSLVRVSGAPPVERPEEGIKTVVITDRAVDSQPLSAPDYRGDFTQKTGLYALEKTDLFNLLCIPPDTREGDTVTQVYQSALDYCVSRRAMLIVDPRAAWSANPETAVDSVIQDLPDLGLNGTAARNAALFFPRIKKNDQSRAGQIDVFVPCGAVAGIFARTDSTRGVWKAPAGMDAAINGITGLEISLSNDENGRLNPLGVNVLRSFPTAGQVIWGARTLRGADRMADEYKYTPVRRTALYIEESLYRGTQWVVFEPNDEPLWAQIRLNVGAFMHDLFRQGAFQGKTPREAYLVKCDKETTTQSDINKGIVNILVGFAPLKPAEFVIIKIQQMAGQIET